MPKVTQTQNESPKLGSRDSILITALYCPEGVSIRKGEPCKAKQGTVTFARGQVLEDESRPKKEREDKRRFIARVPGNNKKNSYGCQKSGSQL